jgi:predicted RecB family nuclease
VGLRLTEASKFGLPIDLKRTSNHIENQHTLTTWLKETQSQLESTKGMFKPIDLRTVKGIGPKTAKKLEDAGIETANDLVSKNLQQVANILGTSEKKASNLLKNARSLI